MIIDGLRELTRALDAGVEVTEVFACLPYCQSETARPVIDCLTQRRVEMLEVSPAVMDRLAFGHRREGGFFLWRYLARREHRPLLQ